MPKNMSDSRFPEESDPWIVKFRMEFDIPEEHTVFSEVYDPQAVLLKNTIHNCFFAAVLSS